MKNNKTKKSLVKSIKRANRLGTLGLDLRTHIADTGKPSAKKQRKIWKRTQSWDE